MKKKVLFLMIAVMLGVAAASPAMAIDWTVLGSFTVKSAVYKNIDYRCPLFMGGIPGSFRITGTLPVYPGFSLSLGGAYALLDEVFLHSSAGDSPHDPAWNRTSWFLQMRGDIFIIAKASEDLKGVFGIEVNSSRFGDADTTYIPYFPGSLGTGFGNAGRWNADAVAISVKSMYIDFKVPEVPLWFKVGIQPFRLRENVFLYADAAGVSGSLKLDLDPVLVKINPFWARIYGTWPFATTDVVGGVGFPNQNYVPTDWTTADDGNFFGVDINATSGPIKSGIFFAEERLGHIFDLPAGIFVFFPWLPTPGFTPAGSGSANLWWLGFYTDATVGPLTVNYDFIYNGGWDGVKSGFINFCYPASAFSGANWPGQYQAFGRRESAFLTRGQVSYNMNKLTFGLGASYGTGDNPTTLGKDEGYHVPYNSAAAFFNNDFLILTGDWGLREPFGSWNSGGLFKTFSDVGQGVWYVRAFADYQLFDWLKLKANVGYIGDTVSHGDEFSTDSMYVNFNGHTIVPQVDKGSDSIGWEMDFGVQINIYKNLFFDTAFGYLIGGKALLSQYGGYRAQDPWALESVLTYQF